MSVLEILVSETKYLKNISGIFGILLEKNPNPGDLGLFGNLPLGFFGRKNLKFQKPMSQSGYFLNSATV